MDENVLCEWVCLARSRARISNMLYYLVFHSAATEIEKFLPFAVNNTMLCTDHIFVKYTLFFAHTHTQCGEPYSRTKTLYNIFHFSIFHFFYSILYSFSFSLALIFSHLCRWFAFLSYFLVPFMCAYNVLENTYNNSSKSTLSKSRWGFECVACTHA